METTCFAQKFFLGIISIVLAASFSCAFADAAPAAAAPATPTTATPQPQGVAQVVWVKGTIKAISENKIERTLKRRDPVFTKDTLKSDASGSGQIIFTDNSTVAIQENTVLKIADYKFTKGGGAQGNSDVMEIAKGGFRTITGFVSKENPEGYKVKTPVGTIAVRGTLYRVLIQDQKTFIHIEQGTVVLSNPAGQLVISPETQANAVLSGINVKPVAIPASQLPPEIISNKLQLLPATVPTAAELQKATAVSPASSSLGTTTNSGATSTSTPGTSTPSGTTSGGTAPVKSSTGGFCISN